MLNTAASNEAINYEQPYIQVDVSWESLYMNQQTCMFREFQGPSFMNDALVFASHMRKVGMNNLTCIVAHVDGEWFSVNPF